MELLLSERFVLIDILPKEGDYATLKELHMLRQELAPDADEIEELEIVTQNGRVQWNPEKGNTYTREIVINSWGVKKIQETLREINANHKLTVRDLSLYEKFIVAYDQV